MSRETAPALRETDPTMREPTPMPQETAPTMREPTPMSREPAPTMRETDPALPDTAPRTRQAFTTPPRQANQAAPPADLLRCYSKFRLFTEFCKDFTKKKRLLSVATNRIVEQVRYFPADVQECAWVIVRLRSFLEVMYNYIDDQTIKVFHRCEGSEKSPCYPAIPINRCQNYFSSIHENVKT